MRTPKFLCRNILGIAFWLENRGDGEGQRICPRASKQKFLSRMYVYLRVAFGEGWVVKSYPKATWHSAVFYLDDIPIWGY